MRSDAFFFSSQAELINFRYHSQSKQPSMGLKDSGYPVQACRQIERGERQATKCHVTHAVRNYHFNQSLPVLINTHWHAILNMLGKHGKKYSEIHSRKQTKN